MLFDTRERGREAQANRLAQAQAVPAPHPPEPPRPVPRFNNVGDFEWVDNPRTYARYTVTFPTLI